MRTIASIFILTVFLIGINYYIYNLGYNCKTNMDAICLKRIYCILVSSMSLFYIIDEMLGYTSFFHKQFNIISKLSICINFIMFMFIYFQVLTSPVKQLLLFNGSMLAVTSMLLISGVRHGAFKN